MLILLDIDGVLVPANSWKKPEFLADGFAMFNSRAVTALQRIISETNATVLLTTSHKAKYSVPQWCELFRLRGVNPEKIDRLETDSLQISRKDEILQWHLQKHVPTEEFVIIDDDKMLNDLPEYMKSNLVLTSPSVGLTDELADDAIVIYRKRLTIIINCLTLID